MRSGEDRDDIVTRDGVISFEMEGSGVREIFPASLVIKGCLSFGSHHIEIERPTSRTNPRNM
jgi:hypothetical protein